MGIIGNIPITVNTPEKQINFNKSSSGQTLRVSDIVETKAEGVFGFLRKPVSKFKITITDEYKNTREYSVTGKEIMKIRESFQRALQNPDTLDETILSVRKLAGDDLREFNNQIQTTVYRCFINSKGEIKVFEFESNKQAKQSDKEIKKLGNEIQVENEGEDILTKHGNLIHTIGSVQSAANGALPLQVQRRPEQEPPQDLEEEEEQEQQPAPIPQPLEQNQPVSEQIQQPEPGQAALQAAVPVSEEEINNYVLAIKNNLDGARRNLHNLQPSQNLTPDAKQAELKLLEENLIQADICIEEIRNSDKYTELFSEYNQLNRQLIQLKLSLE